METNELVSMIDKLVHEKTFNLEALEGIKVVRDRAADLEKQVANLTRKCAQAYSENDYQKGQIALLTAKVEAAIKRETDLLEREAAVTTHEKDAAVAMAESGAFKHALEVVFRPNTVRETIHSRIPISQSMSGGGSYVSDHQRTDHVIKEEG